MSEIKKLGFGLMRLPQRSANGADIDMEQFKNYYNSFRSAYDVAFERGDYSAQTAKIDGAFDVTAALKEAVKTQIENSFQGYMD